MTSHHWRPLPVATLLAAELGLEPRPATPRGDDCATKALAAGRGVGGLRHEDIGKEYLKDPLDVCRIDEDEAVLAPRVMLIRTGIRWAEAPPSRLVTNLCLVGAATSGDGDQTVEASCKFLMYRNRNADEEDMPIGKRMDTLSRRPGEGRKVAKRVAYGAQSVLPARNSGFRVGPKLRVAAIAWSRVQ